MVSLPSIRDNRWLSATSSSVSGSIIMEPGTIGRLAAPRV